MQNFLNKLLLKKINLIYFFIFFGLIKLIFYYFIPVNILANAPHDDFLFYRLGKSISDFNWLGDYDQLTLIKGPIYPIFISLSIFLSIPLRIMEGILSLLASIYFLNSTSKIFSSNRSKLIIFLLINFFPFVFTSLDYRILRDSIYIYLFLFILSDIFYIILHSSDKVKLSFLRFYSLGFFIAIFNLTREEGIWILPGMLIFIGSIYLINKNFKIILILLITSFFSLFITTSLFKIINYYNFNSTILNTFKDDNFDYGYSSLFRIKHNSDIKRISIPKESWQVIFDISPSANTLKKYIYGPGYEGWILTACGAIRDQHPDEDNSNCEEGMLTGYLMMALIDALYQSGYDSPQKVSNVMKKIGDEITLYCNNTSNLCSDASFKMMPPSTFKIQTLYDSFNKLPHAYNILTNSHNIPIDKIQGSGFLKDVSLIATNLNLFIFNFKVNNKMMIDEDLPKYEKIGNHNYDAKISQVDKLKNQIVFKGFNYSDIVDILIVINDKYTCKAKTINNVFSCVFDYNLQFPINIEAYIQQDRKLFQIKFNKDLFANLAYFDEDCYLTNNPDVANAVKNKIFTSGFEHWKNHGSNEQRLCTPNDYFDYISDSKIKHSIYSDYSVNLVNLLFYFYKFLMNIGFIIILIGLFCLLKVRNIRYLSICIILLCFTITRLSLISLLDVTGLAPITGMYLLSGTFSYFLLIIFCLDFIIKYQKKIIN